LDLRGMGGGFYPGLDAWQREWTVIVFPLCVLSRVDVDAEPH